MHTYPDYETCLKTLSTSHVFALSSHGKTLYTQPSFQAGDAFLFGPETRGLGQGILNEFEQDFILRLPQQTSARSLNLSNTVAVMIYEAWRQLDFASI